METEIYTRTTRSIALGINQTVGNWRSRRLRMVWGGSGAGPASRSESGLEERLTGILVDEGDGDLLVQQSNREDFALQWLEALDMHVMAACRADERLKPLLKMNASNDVAEDRLLAQLRQHFEPAEVAMLARCFCIPLVSTRVGKINKQGTLLCPTAAG